MTASVVEETTTISGLGERLRAYVALTKPRVIELLLITTLPAMILAAQGWPGTWLVVATLIGGTLSAAGANTLNSYLDRDIDELMGRTKQRPLPVHDIEATTAFWFGIALGVAGFVWLWVFTNLTAALWSTAALVFYVVVYTIMLKRTTTQNIVIGGAAGGAPALVGWAAVTGGVGLPAWVLFAIVFYWTPPHFWALALRYDQDYARAAVPMLPVIRGREATLRQIVIYSSLLVWLTLLLVPVAGMGWIYLIGSIVLGAWFFWEAWRMTRTGADPIRLFTVSNIYLAALSAVIVADVLVR